MLFDLENPDYESIKATIKHSDAVIIASDSLSPSLTKIYRIFRKTFYLSSLKMNSRKYTNSIKTRFLSI
jgi:starch synthase